MGKLSIIISSLVLSVIFLAVPFINYQPLCKIGQECPTRYANIFGIVSDRVSVQAMIGDPTPYIIRIIALIITFFLTVVFFYLIISILIWGLKRVKNARLH